VSETGSPDSPTSARSTVRRHRERGNYDRSVLNAILDEGLICHVGFSDDNTTYVLPTGYARVDDVLYVHGASANHMLEVLARETPACVTVTLLDGLVLARASFHHSMNYRSAVIFSSGSKVDDPAEKLFALNAIVEHIVPGRMRDARPPTADELRATLVVRLPIEEFSAKVRVGPPIDDDDDHDLPIWAGVIPLQLESGPAITDPGLIPGLAIPSYAAHYPSRG
jgi:nitroimidazol reductase NimA-like FMN-containing flavoprotein (pyridoxamine 5'-phosphate oxidase superfamily)